MQNNVHFYQLAKNYLQKDTPQELYQQFLVNLTSDKADEIRCLAQLFVEKERSKLLHQAKWLIVTSAANAETAKISAGARDKSDPKDLEQRIHFSRIESAKAQVELLLKLQVQYDKTTELTAAAKKFATKFLQPALKCL